jgi:hypothetical protein
MPQVIDLALETPTPHLKQFAAHTEFDFTLAHHVLMERRCREFHARRAANRLLILDNSMHELGSPLPVPALIVAAQLVHANILVPPDKLNVSMATNLRWLRETHAALRATYPFCKPAAVLCGRTAAARLAFVQIARALNIACLMLPFRKPRKAWFQHLLRAGVHFSHVHLLGVSERAELQWFAQVAASLPNTLFSVDTSKPIKWALCGRRMDDGRPWRGAPVSSQDVLRARLTPAQLKLAIENVRILKEALSCDAVPSTPR